MNVLAFDCAGAACSAAVLRGDRVAAKEVRAMARGQAEVLVPMIERVLAAATTRFDDLDLIAVTTGPGSFTGVRIGLAAARGLALATGVPATGLSSFAAFAMQAPLDPRGRPLAVVLDSRRDDIFLQCFDESGTPLADPCAATPEAARALLPDGEVRLAGDAALLLLPLLDARGELVADSGTVDPAALGRAAAARWRAGATAPLVPLYLRPPDTTLPRPRHAAP